MPTCILLAGPQGSGKTTFRNTHLNDFFCASTDDLIQAEAIRQGVTYTEVFDSYFNEAQEVYEESIAWYQSRDTSFVIDRTHITEASRKRSLKLINPRYKKIVVYMPAYTPELLMSRIEARTASGGHHVAENYVRDFHARYTIPKYSEGFDLVISSSELVRTLKVMDFK